MSLNQNQFKQAPVLGQMDLRMNNSVVSCIVDSTQATALLSGQSVKLVDNASGIPSVVATAADGDTVFGWISFSNKDAGHSAGDAVEVVTMYGSVMFLVATAAIARGALLKGVVATVGGVATAAPGSGSKIIGWAYDKAANSGDLIRVVVNCPSFFVA